MIKDARLSIRITPELDSWLDAEAASRGLDKAAFARMVLFERMNGMALLPRAAPVASAVSAEYWADENPGHEYADQPEQPIDVEAIVAQRVAEALARQPQAYAEGETGMQAHRRGLMPAYGNSSPRIQRVGVAPAA
jgi:hypothetical protein